ncbi:MAG: hypothetical protein R2762_15765 [Bryobacteraceae bacterium]
MNSKIQSHPSATISEGNSSKPVTVKFTVAELKLLASLASDQLFRREFIDPKMPGYVSNPDEVHLGKALVSRLRSMLAAPGSANG